MSAAAADASPECESERLQLLLLQADVLRLKLDLAQWRRRQQQQFRQGLSAQRHCSGRVSCCCGSRAAVLAAPMQGSAVADKDRVRNLLCNFSSADQGLAVPAEQLPIVANSTPFCGSTWG